VSPRIAALGVICAIVTFGSLIGFLARSHRKMDLEQWTVGGRGFGLVLVWLLMAGEIFTTFTFFGASGWAYSQGAPVLYILGYCPLNFAVSFYILPPLWEVGRKHKLQTQADFFQALYGNKWLAAFVALIGVVSLVPYVQIQVTGLGIIAEIASFGAIHRTPAMLIGFALVAAFVFTSGIRGVAWVSVPKDLLLLVVAVFVGIAVPHIYFGGIGPMFAALIRAHPAHLVMPGSSTSHGHSWYVSTVLLIALGFYMWPQYFAASFTASSGKILRRNAVIMPLYCITMPLMFFVGLAALLIEPGLKNGDLSMLTMVRKTFSPWFLGVVGGAGALTAMVPAAIQLLTGATLYAKNLVRPIVAPRMTDQQVARLAKLMVLVLTFGAVLLAIYSSPSLVTLWLMGSAWVAQFFPGVIAGLFSKRLSAAAVFAGLITGIAVTVILMLTGRDPYHGVNAGFIALCLNGAVTWIVTAFVRRGQRHGITADDPPPAFQPDLGAEPTTALSAHSNVIRREPSPP
jgi:SSS family solute:Na+ symporter